MIGLYTSILGLVEISKRNSSALAAETRDCMEASGFGSEQFSKQEGFEASGFGSKHISK